MPQRPDNPVETRNVVDHEGIVPAARDPTPPVNDTDRYNPEISLQILALSPDCVKVLSRDGRLEFMNESGRYLLEIDNLDELVGRPWADLWPAAARTRIADALEAAQSNRVSRFVAACPTAKGAP